MTRHVVVVDDQVDLLEIVRLALDLETDWSVSTHTTVDSALASAAAADVVLLDHSVIEADPANLVAALRDGYDAPVILLTGARLLATDVERLGAQGFIPKPFDVTSLADDIGGVLDWH